MKIKNRPTPSAAPSPKKLKENVETVKKPRTTKKDVVKAKPKTKQVTKAFPRKTAVATKPKTAKKAVVKRKAETTTKRTPVTKKPKTVGVKPKSKSTSSLAPERQKEIFQITLKAKRNPAVTLELINRMLKIDARNKAYIKNIPKFRELLNEHRVLESKNVDESKLTRINKLYEDKLEMLDTIEKLWASNPGFIQSKHEVFLRSIHPKKPISSYMRFGQEVRSRIQKENPEAKFGDMGRLIGQAWKNLSDDEKQTYATKVIEQDGTLTATTTTTTEVSVTD